GADFAAGRGITFDDGAAGFATGFSGALATAFAVGLECATGFTTVFAAGFTAGFPEGLAAGLAGGLPPLPPCRLSGRARWAAGFAESFLRVMVIVRSSLSLHGGRVRGARC